MAESTVTLIYLLSGCFVVLIFAVNYFNQPGYPFIDETGAAGQSREHAILEPALPKYLTNRFEYNLYLFAYVFVCEVVFLALVFFLPDILERSVVQPVVPFTLSRGNIVLATLIITGIAPNLPYIKKVLEISKCYLHDKAQIPRKGRCIYRDLKNFLPSYNESVITDILREEPYCMQTTDSGCSRPDLEEADFYQDSWTIGGRYAKLSYLLHIVGKWSKRAPFRHVIDNPELRYSAIIESYVKLYGMKKGYELGVLSESDSQHFNNFLDLTLHRTYRLISCLLYLALKSDVAVKEHLGKLGYSTEKKKEFYIPWDRLVFMVAAIMLSIIIGGFSVMGIAIGGFLELSAEVTTQNIIEWTIYAVPFLTLPIILVLCTKRYLSMRDEVWPAVNEAGKKLSFDERPWHVYFLLSLASLPVGGLILFFVAFTLSWYKNQEVGPLGDMLEASMVWSGIVMVTVAFLAYRLDSQPDTLRSLPLRVMRNGMEALIQGFVTSLAAYVAFTHTFHNGHFFNPLNLPDPQKSKMMIYCMISFFIGFSLYLVTGLNLFRQKRHDERYPFMQSVKLNSGNLQLEGRFVNLSPGGALIECEDSSKIGGSRVELSFQGSQQIEAEIRRRRSKRLSVEFSDKEAWRNLQRQYGMLFGG